MASTSLGAGAKKRKLEYSLLEEEETSNVDYSMIVDFKTGNQSLFFNKDHSQRLLEHINHLREKSVLYDVKLVVEGIEIPANKIFLAACSPYFDAMFQGSTYVESDKDKVEIKGVDPTALKQIIDYIYTSQLSINEENV